LMWTFVVLLVSISLLCGMDVAWQKLRQCVIIF